MEKISEKMKKVFESKTIMGVLIGVGALLVLVVVFAAGMSLGFHRASFGSAWQENYERNFGPTQRSGHFFLSLGPGGGDLPNAYGATGKIVKISLPSFIVADRDNTEKTIIINNGTDIREQKASITSADLKTGNFVVVIGSPDQSGRIDATLIRVLPAPNLIFNGQTGVGPGPANQ